MKKIIFLKTGEIKLVANNEAHALIEQGKAAIYTDATKTLVDIVKGKEIEKPLKDKMITKGKKYVARKSREY